MLLFYLTPPSKKKVCVKCVNNLKYGILPSIESVDVVIIPYGETLQSFSALPINIKIGKKQNNVYAQR